MASERAVELGKWILWAFVLGLVLLVATLLLYGSDVYSSVFAVWVYYVISVAAGALVSKIMVFGTSFPDLIGMMLVGFAYGESLPWSDSIRQLALAIILMRAGLVLDLAALKRLGRATVLLSFIPCLVEAVVVALAAKLILSPPWTWCFLLGFIIAAVSPAVVVPSLTQLQKEGYGTRKGIPSMVLAAAGLDDVVAVTGFGVFLGIALSGKSLLLNLFHGPIDLAIGLLGGPLVGGCIGSLRYLPGLGTAWLSSVLILVGAAAVVGLGKVDHTGGGCLLAMVAAFTVKHLWHDEQLARAEAGMKLAWDSAGKPLLFALIGAAVEISTLDGPIVGYAVGIVCIGLAFRLPVCYLCTMGSGLASSERLFVAFAWLPKATVQAALGPVPLDKVREEADFSRDEERWGEQILAISALAILLTAPVGALSIAIFGPKWLSNDNITHHAPDDAEEGSGGSSPPPAAPLPPPQHAE